MQFLDRLNNIKDKHKTLGEKLNQVSDPQEIVKLSKEYSELSPVVEKIDTYLQLEEELDFITEMIASTSNTKEREELEIDQQRCMEQLEQAKKEVQLSLLPKDVDDNKNVIIEIRAGTGGDEAALFAASLFEMYHKYAQRNKWKFEIISISEIGLGGYKEASANIIGNNVFARLKFESGVHRVQRVPVTETQGRVHTSAATVAVLPEVEDIDVKINEKDLRIDIFRASGPGGQSVNTTDSAVRIVHIPTGITVSQQDEKSQHKNKEKAMKVLRSRIYEKEKQEAEQLRSADRKQQVGSGDRSERIRTYNFPQGRVTEHRINLTLYKIDAIVKEGMLDEVIDALIVENQSKLLANEI